MFINEINKRNYSVLLLHSKLKNMSFIFTGIFPDATSRNNGSKIWNVSALRRVTPCLVQWTGIPATNFIYWYVRSSDKSEIWYAHATSLKKSLKSLSILEILEKPLDFSKNFRRSLKSPWISIMIREILEFSILYNMPYANISNCRRRAALYKKFGQVAKSWKTMKRSLKYPWILLAEFRGNPIDNHLEAVWLF